MTILSSPIGTDYRPAAEAAVRALADAVTHVHLPGSPDYGRLTVTSNLTQPIRPLAVVEVLDAHEVSTTLRLAAAFGVRVAVQGTGHGATESMHDAVLVHTARLDELEVHPRERWARVGAGLKWKTVIEAAAEHGLAGLSGSSPDVGVVGFLTGGGLGPLARSHGLSSDWVRAFDVVTGDGEVRRASATENPDLFWGLRGGKGALGVVTAVEIDLAPLPEVYGGALWFDGGDVDAVIRTWSQWCELLPEQGTTSFAVMRLPALPFIPEILAGKTTVTVRFVWTGDPAEGEELIRAIRSVAAPIIDTVGTMPYAAIGSVHDDGEDPLPLHEATLLLDEFGPDTAGAFLDVIGATAQSTLVMAEVRQLGGRVRTGDDCAFAHRDAAFNLFAGGIMIPEIAEAVVGDANRLTAALAPWAQPVSLPNFTTSSGTVWAERVFTPAVARRLRELSLRYDPDGVLLAARGVRG